MDNPPVLGSQSETAIVNDIRVSPLATTVNNRRPFYKKPILLALLMFVIGGLTVGTWLIYGFLNRDKSGGLECHLLKPITYLSDFRQQYYNERCRVAWFTAKVPIKEPINHISFELEFIGNTGARGLLTVSLDNQQIGTINQAEAEPGKHEYGFNTPMKGPGEYDLNFRLVPTNDIPFSVNVNNVRTGLISAGTPSVEAVPQFETKLNPMMNFNAQPANEFGTVELDAQVVTLQATSNMLAWMVVPLELSEEINWMEFDLDFISNPAAEGLVAIYIDDKAMGVYDERFTDDKKVTHVEVPLIGSNAKGNIPSGRHTFSIRLDAHSQATSIVQVSNIQTGLVYQSQ